MMLSFSDFFCIAGPCVIEGQQFTLDCATALRDIFATAGVPLIFKASFDKANRSSGQSFRGVGLENGLNILAEVREHLHIPVLTDIHEPAHAAMAAHYVDVLQIPALLCRQTDLIVAAAATGKPVLFKKGQFLAPWDMARVVEKAHQASLNAGHGSGEFLVCERGTSFGYNNLVVDMRSLPILAETTGCPVVFDATHSVQLPGALGHASGGQRQFVAPLARAAIATGSVSGLFMETHPQPGQAPCDSAVMIPFDALPSLLTELQGIRDIMSPL